MISSLSKQLESLRLKQKDQKQLPKNTLPSFIFPQKDASKIDIQIIYTLAHDAVHQLARMKPELMQLVPVLFSQSCTKFRRGNLKVEVVQTFDQAITKLIDQIAQYFLYPACQKIIEFLIRIYQAHAYHKERIVLAFLPFCETGLFSKLIQQLNLASDASFKFLVKYSNSGKIVRESDLTYHFIKGTAATIIIKSLKYALNQQIIPSYNYEIEKKLSGDVMMLQSSSQQNNIYEGYFIDMIGMIFQKFPGMKQKLQTSVLQNVIPLLSRVFSLKHDCFNNLKAGAIKVTLMFINNAKINIEYIEAFIIEFAKIGGSTSDLQLQSLVLKAINSMIVDQKIVTVSQKCLGFLVKLIEQSSQEECEFKQLLKMCLINSMSIQSENSISSAHILLNSAKNTIKDSLMLHDLISQILIVCFINGVSMEKLCDIFQPLKVAFSHSLVSITREIQQDSQNMVMFKKYCNLLIHSLQINQIAILLSQSKGQQYHQVIISSLQSQESKLNHLENLIKHQSLSDQVIQSLAVNAFKFQQSQKVLQMILLNLDRKIIENKQFLQTIEEFLDNINHQQQSTTKYSVEFQTKIVLLLLENVQKSQFCVTTQWSLVLFLIKHSKQPSSQSIKKLKNSLLQSILQQKFDQFLKHNQVENIIELSQNLVQTLQQPRNYAPILSLLALFEKILSHFKLSDHRFLQISQKFIDRITSLATSENYYFAKHKDYSFIIINCINILGTKLQSLKMSHASLQFGLSMLKLSLIDQQTLPLTLVILKNFFKSYSLEALYEIILSDDENSVVNNSFYFTRQILLNISSSPLQPEKLLKILLQSITLLQLDEKQQYIEYTIQNLKLLLNYLQEDKRILKKKDPLLKIDSAVFSPFGLAQRIIKIKKGKKLKSQFSVKGLIQCLKFLVSNEAQLIANPRSLQILLQASNNNKIMEVRQFLVSTIQFSKYLLTQKQQSILLQFYSKFTFDNFNLKNLTIIYTHSATQQNIRYITTIIRNHLPLQQKSYYESEFKDFINENINFILQISILLSETVKSQTLKDSVKSQIFKILINLIQLNESEQSEAYTAKEKIAQILQNTISLLNLKWEEYQAMLMKEDQNLENILNVKTVIKIFYQIDIIRAEFADQITDACFKLLESYFFEYKFGIESRTLHLFAHQVFLVLFSTLRMSQMREGQFMLIQKIIVQLLSHIKIISCAYLLKNKEKSESQVKGHEFSILKALKTEENENIIDTGDQLLIDFIRPKINTLQKLINLTNKLLIFKDESRVIQILTNTIQQIRRHYLQSQTINQYKSDSVGIVQVKETFRSIFQKTIEGAYFTISKIQQQTPKIIDQLITLILEYDDITMNKQEVKQWKKEQILKSLQYDSENSFILLGILFTFITNLLRHSQEEDQEKINLIDQLFRGILQKSSDSISFLINWIIGNVVIDCQGKNLKGKVVRSDKICNELLGNLKEAVDLQTITQFARYYQQKSNKVNEFKSLALSLTSEFVSTQKFKQHLDLSPHNQANLFLLFQSTYFLYKQLNKVKNLLTTQDKSKKPKKRSEEYKTIKKLLKQSKNIFQSLSQNISIQSYFILIQNFLLHKEGNDNFGTLYDQALFQLNLSLYQIIQKETFSQQIFQKMKQFISLNYLPIFESNRLDVFQARLIQIFFNITSEMLQPLSFQTSLSRSDKSLFIQTIPNCLVNTLELCSKQDDGTSYSVTHRKLLRMNAIITLTNFIKYFSKYTLQFCNPLIDGIVKLQSKHQSMNNTLIQASFRCLIQIIQSTKNFVSGKMTQIINFVIESDDDAVKLLRSELIQCIVRQMDLRNCIKPMFKVYGNILEKLEIVENSIHIPKQLLVYLQLLHSLIRYSKDKEILAAKSKLAQLLSIILSFHKDYKGSLQGEEEEEQKQKQQLLQTLQYKINETFIQFYMKLKQSDLKTVLVELIKEQKQTDQIDFKLSFWAMMIQTLQNIKSYAVPYFSHCIDRVVQQMNQLNQKNQQNLGFRKYTKSKEISSKMPQIKDYLLMQKLLNYINLNFKHDQKGVIQMTWFEMLIQPVSDIFKKFRVQNFITFAESYLLPCVQQMFQGYDDNDKQRDLLNSILMKIRDNSYAQQRFSVAKCVHVLIENLKDKILIYLRDIVPFITELQDDQDEKVSKEAEKCVYSIQKLTGQSLKDYM